MSVAIRIATRASRLALWQTHHVEQRLRAIHPDIAVEILEITTEGDRILDQPLATIGGKGLFIKELETALIENRADIAVHSMKDVPAELPQGLHIPVILEREDPMDVLVSASGAALGELPPGSRVGTSSLRRSSQLLAMRPDLSIENLRGNVPTRLRKLEEGQFDAVVLAAAGLRRLDLFDGRCVPLSFEQMLPAVGQGAIGIECRAGDEAVEHLIAGLTADRTASCVVAERAMNAKLGGSCEAPIAGHAEIAAGELTLEGLVATVDGATIVRQTASGPESEARAIGSHLGALLLAAGAEQILHELIQRGTRH